MANKRSNAVLAHTRTFVYDRKKRKLVETKRKPVPRSCSAWPMKSDALGVSPEQIPEAMAEAIRYGVPTEFDPRTGEAILTSPGHRRRYAEMYGIYDRNGGYSDPQQNKDRFNPREFGNDD